jgi:hypothetical protein
MKSQELKNELSRKGSELASWRNLVESAGWKQFKATMEQQRMGRLFAVGETRLESFGATLGQEFMKGEAAGIGLALMFPLAKVEELQRDVTILLTSIELEADNVQETPPAGSGSRVDNSSFNIE